MNIYFVGMIIVMAAFLVISYFVSRKVRNAEDFYVAGRNAPVLLIAGSLLASYMGTGLFMGDAATSYKGALGPMTIIASMLGAGSIFGAVFFGRQLRRSNTITIPEYFGMRFHSDSMRMLSAVVSVVTMAVYLISVVQGLGTLMSTVTGVHYHICLIACAAVFTFISVTAGSKGVLITDTLMAALFTLSLLIGIGFIAKETGGYFDTIRSLASDPDTSAILSWTGKPGVLGFNVNSTFDVILWGGVYGIVWGAVGMISPWQASRYQMAKSEHVILKSSLIAAFGLFALDFFAMMAALLVNRVYPDMPDPSRVMIWASMNLMPKIIGVILLTGILSAGISSATTFQSLIGASVSNDIMKLIRIRMHPEKSAEQNTDRRDIRIGRIAMIAAAVIAVAISVTNPQALFIIMFLGSSMIASTWMPVAIASVFSKRVTKTGAFCGMLAGFAGAFIYKIATYFAGWEPPVYLDSALVGMVLNVIAMTIGSAFTQVTDQEKAARKKILTMPESEKEPGDVKRTLRVMRIGCFVGVGIFAVLLIFWLIPYMNAVGK
ncbi:MAG: sodium:solute symporter family protein [Parasporobacterium sp.]|nr:sodium:solute symporter family protein [Parasporobacterium sp.]